VDYIYTLELYKDPLFPKVPSRPDFSSDPYYISVISSAYVFGNRQTLSIFASGWTVYQLSKLPGTTPHFLSVSVSLSPNIQNFKEPKSRKNESKKGISPFSARRSRASLITSTRLRRVTEGLASTTARGILPKEKTCIFRGWLALDSAQTSLANQDG
jgi:hypothetical protein